MRRRLVTAAAALRRANLLPHISPGFGLLIRADYMSSSANNYRCYTLGGLHSIQFLGFII
jgi:hypothetical protein